MRSLGSDNHSGVHPRIMKALSDANTDHAPSYGTDELSKKADEVFARVFGPGAKAYFVFNGTGANVCALSAVVQPHHAVLASRYAHLVMDECGAPERHLGCKIISVDSPDAKLTPELLKPQLIRRGDQHASQPRAISITQSTELGTVYSLNEIRALSEFARAERLLLHMDGARLVNAAASLGCTLKEMTTDCGVDLLSLGGTKNGLMFGEAVVFLKPGLNEDFQYKRKALLQLPSKTRFVASQFSEFLGTDLWLENARHANQMAQYLRTGLEKLPVAKITQLTQANGVFVIFPRKMVAKLKETIFFYVWDEHTFECRLMTTWDTTKDDCDKLLAKVKELSES